MKYFLTIAITFFMLSSITVFAHDPKEHASENEAPNCQMLASMDHEKMEMNDPIMLAMQENCKGTMMDDHGNESMMDHMPEDTHAAEADGHNDHN
jgi:hypothetical protein